MKQMFSALVLISTALSVSAQTTTMDRAVVKKDITLRGVKVTDFQTTGAASANKVPTSLWVSEYVAANAGGGAVPNLQTVTSAGSSTTTSIEIFGTNRIFGVYNDDESAFIGMGTSFDGRPEVTFNPANNHVGRLTADNITQNNLNWQLPDHSGTIATMDDVSDAVSLTDGSGTTANGTGVDLGGFFSIPIDIYAIGTGDNHFGVHAGGSAQILLDKVTNNSFLGDYDNTSGGGLLTISVNGLSSLTTSGSDGEGQRFGIGTTTPTEALDVLGNIKASGNATISGTLKIPNASGDYDFVVDGANHRYTIGDTNGNYNGTGIDINDQTDSKQVIIVGGGGVRILPTLQYSDNASALAAGLLVGTLYRTGDVLKVVH